jgi:undecaprenyl-diphosphatase
LSEIPRTIATPRGGKRPAAFWRLRTFVADRLNPNAFLGLHLTVGVLLGSLGVWALSALLDAVLDNALLVRWDIAADAWIHARVTPQGLNIFNWISRAGSPASMTVLAIVGAIVLLAQRRVVMLIGWIAAFAGASILENVLKLLVHRHRPVYGAAYVSSHSFSFPSGHATMSFTGMAALLYVLWVYWHPSRRLRVLSIVAAAVAVVLVGVSRIYLGVHYPSDVLGGWATGAAWIAVCVSGVAFALHYRRSP